MCQNCLKTLELKMVYTQSPNPFLQGVWSILDYNQPLVQQMIHLIKYNLVAEAAKFFNPYLKEFSLLVNPWPQSAVLMPVPLFRARYLKRGFNQAEIIAQMASHYLTNPVNSQTLIRVKFQQAQADLGRQARWQNIRNNYLVRMPVVFDQVVLVDDVFTTGATLGECAKVLKQAGVQQVWGLVMASQRKKTAQTAVYDLRRERDSNPRYAQKDV